MTILLHAVEADDDKVPISTSSYSVSLYDAASPNKTSRRHDPIRHSLL